MNGRTRQQVGQTAPDVRAPARGLSRTDFREQLPWLAGASVTAVLLASLAPLADLATDGRIATMDLMSDPAEATGIPWYIGAVNDLNLLVWGAGAALLALAALGLRQADPRLAAALGWLGALTVLLTLDDRFLLHEIVFPWIFGLPQTATFGVYAVLLAAVLARYRRELLRQPELSILLLALACLATSVALDVLGWDSTTRRMAEETAKLLGALAWTLFPAAVLLRHLRGGSELRR